MAQKLTAKTTSNMMKAGQRTEFIEAGGYDGRFKSKTVPNKKNAYTRKGRNDKGYLRGQD